jgi:hypothetical protein
MPVRSARPASADRLLSSDISGLPRPGAIGLCAQQGIVAPRRALSPRGRRSMPSLPGPRAKRWSKADGHNTA